METSAQRLIDADNHLGETPLWVRAEQALYWINCEKPAQVHRWHADSGRHDIWPMPRRIGGLAHKAEGGLLVVLADGIYDFDTGSGNLTLRAASPLPDHVALHECACDRQGRFWVGSFDHHYPADRQACDGFLFRLDGDVLVPVVKDITIANGLAFSPDGTTLYCVNTRANSVEAFDLDPVYGDVSNRRTFLTLARENGFCDGATIDAQGFYWMAAVGGSCLRRYAPDGRLDRIVSLPFSNPTKPAFGGADLATLFITSTRMAIYPQAAGYAENGAIFAMSVGVNGVPECDFAG